MRDATVAARYARALFILSERRGETPRALEDLKGVWEMCRPGTAVGDVLAAPQVLLADKRRVMLETLEGRCLRSVARFLDLLLRKKRLRELETIVAEYEALVERAQGIRRAQVVSAVALTEAELRRLHAGLERYTGGKIKLTTAVDPAVIGGAFVRIGDRVVDRTVRTLLERIGQQMAEAGV